MKRILYFLFIILIVSFVVGCASTQKTVSSNKEDIINKAANVKSDFKENDAINKVIKENPEFPSKQGEIKTIEVRTGGPAPGILVKAQLTTKVEKVDNETYIVTLNKEWHMGNIISYWTYKVTPNKMTLIDNKDNDYRIYSIK